MKKLFLLIFILVSLCFSQNRPSILFQQRVYFDFLEELQNSGFEVDYAEKELTWDLIKNYNVVVIFYTPDAFAVSYRNDKPSEERIKKFVDLIEKYLEEGGSIFIICEERNIKKQMVSDLIKNWGAKIPLERIVEEDNEKISQLENAPSVLIAYTDNIQQSPVSKGIKGIWYPYSNTQNSQLTNPLFLDENWKVVLRTSKTSKTVPIDENPDRWKDFYDEVFFRKGNISEPPIFAIREYKNGRIALMSSSPKFSVYSGKRWYYNGQVLEKGAKGKKSDLGKLLINTFQWLSEKSLKDKKIGGYVNDKERHIPPNYRKEVINAYLSGGWEYKKEEVENVSAPKVNIYKGVIGVKTNYSGYEGTVEEYAKTAENLGLNFLIFMEDFDKIDEDIFEKLVEDCKKYSSNKIKLFPGYTIKTNIGNYMIIYGKPETIKLPPDNILCGSDRKTLYLQEQDLKGNFTGLHFAPTFSWLLEMHSFNQIGYYNFNEVKNGMRITDCRLFSLAGLIYYRNNKLIEDISDEYLTSAQGTIPPSPVAINEVHSPSELINEIKLGHFITCVGTDSLENIYNAGLRYQSQYDGLNIFLSNGPEILSWPACYRPWVWGWGHYFKAEKIVMPSLISLKSDVGLKEVKIYNGRKLYRRFILKGEKEFNKLLILEGITHKNLILIAEDIKGGKAISFYRTSKKDGTYGISFCSDHINDCKGGPDGQKLARGHFFPGINDIYALAWEITGDDLESGGTIRYQPISNNRDIYPVLETDKGKEDGNRFEGPSMLDFADDGMTSVFKEFNKIYSDKVLQVVNPWHTFGTFSSESPKLFTFVLRYKQFLGPTLGPHYDGWPANAIKSGTKSTIFENEIEFKDNFKVNSLCLGSISGTGNLIILKKGSEPEIIDLSKNYEKKKIYLKDGDWFGFFRQEISNTILYRNIGEPIYWDLQNWKIFADIEGKEVKKGERFIYKIYSIGFPVNAYLKDTSSVLKIINFLEKTPDLMILKGKKVEGKVPLEFIPENYKIELKFEKKEDLNQLVLPCVVSNLNPNWTACLFQKKGYILKEFGSDENRFRPLWVDSFGKSYFPLYIDMAKNTWVIVGHPVIAEGDGKELIIQVTKTKEEPSQWHISVNNPTDKRIKTKLKKVIDLPNLNFEEKEIVVEPGEYIVIM